jgi:hypothetical protein
MGFPLKFGGHGMPSLPDLGVIRLFSWLICDMSTMIPDSECRFEDQRQEMARKHFFLELIPEALRYAREHAAHIQKKLSENRSKAQRSSAIPSSSATSATKSPSAARSGAPSRASEEAASGHASGASDTEGEDGNHESRRLASHTFGVLKGENLSCQLLEPEVLHFIQEMRPLFQSLFAAYVDVPVPNTEGHMTLTAFLRFADDFSLFPSQVDFQTLEWLYKTSECFSELPGPPHIDMSFASGLAGAEISFTTAENSPSRALGIDRAQVRRKTRQAKDRSSSEKSPHGRHGGGSGGDAVLWSAKWIRSHLVWLTKDLADMTEVEHRSAEILFAVKDWLDYRCLTISDFCAYYARERDGHRRDVLSAEVLQKVIDFMRLDGAPSSEEVRRLIGLVVLPGCTDLGYPLMKEVFVILHTLTENLERAKNCFLKPLRHMTRAEHSASIFFNELEVVLMRNKWTPQDLFAKLDTDGSGDVDAKELYQESRRILNKQPEPPVRALNIEEPFQLLDLNQDGRISLEEFCLVFVRVGEARELKRNLETRHPIFLCADAMTKSHALDKRVFGRSAFVECLMKIAFVRLSFHGTPHQAQQSSLFKAVWMVLYLHWQFEQRTVKRRANLESSPAQHRSSAAQTSGQQQGLARLNTQPTPLQRLIKESPNLFRDIPHVGSSPNAESWGSPADELLHKCLVEENRRHSNCQISFGARMLARAISGE